MFLESDIALLKDRLGWSEYENPLYVSKLNDGNRKKDSGLTLNGFHKLVTLENIHNSQPNPKMNDFDFNSYLDEILDNVLREILVDVFVEDPIEQENMTSTIAESAGTGLFDNCIGYCHSVKVLELFTASVRSNRIETISKSNYSFIMGELKGRYSKDGVLVSKGLIHYCNESRKRIKKILNCYSGAVIQDATDQW